MKKSHYEKLIKFTTILIALYMNIQYYVTLRSGVQIIKTTDQQMLGYLILATQYTNIQLNIHSSLAYLCSSLLTQLLTYLVVHYVITIPDDINSELKTSNDLKTNKQKTQKWKHQSKQIKTEKQQFEQLIITAPDEMIIAHSDDLQSSNIHSLNDYEDIVLENEDQKNRREREERRLNRTRESEQKDQVQKEIVYNVQIDKETFQNELDFNTITRTSLDEFKKKQVEEMQIWLKHREIVNQNLLVAQQFKALNINNAHPNMLEKARAVVPEKNKIAQTVQIATSPRLQIPSPRPQILLSPRPQNLQPIAKPMLYIPRIDEELLNRFAQEKQTTEDWVDVEVKFYPSIKKVKPVEIVPEVVIVKKRELLSEQDKIDVKEFREGILQKVHQRLLEIEENAHMQRVIRETEFVPKSDLHLYQQITSVSKSNIPLNLSPIAIQENPNYIMKNEQNRSQERKYNENFNGRIQERNQNHQRYVSIEHKPRTQQSENQLSFNSQILPFSQFMYTRIF